MATFGLDLSHHQDLALNLAQCRREGIEFVFLKATEGSSFVDSEFDANLAEARAAGLLPAAYHYLRSSAPASAQVAHIRKHVPLDVPVIPDVEANSGAIGLTREFVARLKEAGYRVPLLYLPRWYWQQIGSPSLVGLPPLWSSRYPDNVRGSIADEWADIPTHYWTGYGGLDVAVLQFTSSATIAGHAPLDANAYRGTREQLAELLGYTQEEPVENLVLGQRTNDPAVWVGDGITRRHIADETELKGLQWWIGQQGGDPTVHPIEDLRVLGTPLGAPMPPVDLAPVIAYLEAHPPVAALSAEQVAQVAAAVVAEFKKEGN